MPDKQSRKKHRSVDDIVARFRAKCDPDVMKRRLTAARTRMGDNFEKQARMLDLVRSIVRGVTDEAGVPGIIRFFYLSFARAVYGRWRRYRPGPLAGELTILRLQWAQRGLDPQLLQRVQDAVTEALELTRSQKPR